MRTPHVEIYRSQQPVGWDDDADMALWRDTWRWRMRASNGRIVSQSSEGYLEPRDLVRGLEIAMPGWEMVVSGSADGKVRNCYLYPTMVVGHRHIPVTVPEGTETLWAARRNR